MRIEIKKLMPEFLDKATKILAKGLIYDELTWPLVNEKLFKKSSDPYHTQTITLGAFKKEELIGVMTGYIMRSWKRGYLGPFSVLPSYRRQGVASALLQEMESIFKKTGVKEVSTNFHGL
jgi:GNAT superfamily N-acetyltransferase